MIVSFARLPNESTILTVVHHEIGHMFGLPHCEDAKCIMQAGQHETSVVKSEWVNSTLPMYCAGPARARYTRLWIVQGSAQEVVSQ